VCNGRPELKEQAPELFTPRTNRRVIELDALDEAAGAAMVRELLGRQDLNDDIVASILDAAGGNPLFLEEIALMWRDSGETSAELLAIPTGLQALIDSRLDALPAEERRLVTHAAVVGNTFWSGTIASLESQRTDDIAAALDALERRDLIRSQPTTISGQQEFVFKSGLIRDAAYARLTKAERAQLHQGCGSWIAGLPAGEDEFAEIIAYHLEQACRVAADLSLADAAAPMLPAARALRLAGSRAEARQGIREAESFFARAIDLLGDQYPEASAEAALQRGRMLVGLGRYDDAKEQYRLVAERSTALHRLDIRCQALISLAEVFVPLGALAEADPCVHEADDLARQLADPSLRIRTMWIKAMLVEIAEGPSVTVIETLQSAVALAEEVDDRGLALTARLRLGATYFNKGELELAEVHFERCLELARQQGTLRAEAWCSACLGLIRFHRGPRSDADKLFAQAVEWLDRLNDAYMQAQTLIWRADAAIARRETEAALAMLRRADTLARPIGGALAVRAARYLAEVLGWQKRTQEARELVQLAREQAEDEDQLAQADVLIAQGFAAFAANDATETRRAFAQAMPILDKRDAPIDLGTARLSSARVLEAIGDIVAAGDQLDRAREAFERVGATATVAEIEADLARLRDAEIGSSSSASESLPG
jgi:tetratricopeptide (TPR) repeat protein